MAHLVTASFGLGEALLTVLEVFLLFAWLWILISIVGDLFSDHTVSGWGKAAWTIVLVLAPFLGAFVYLIARGGEMHERAARREAAARSQLEAYVRQTASPSPTEELVKLAELQDRGVISEAEFERAKSKILNGNTAAAHTPAASDKEMQ